MTARRSTDTEIVVSALENLAREDTTILYGGRAAELATDLHSGELMLAHCADEECSHGWHYTEHGSRMMISPLGWLVILLCVLAVCATVAAVHGIDLGVRSNDVPPVPEPQP